MAPKVPRHHFLSPRRHSLAKMPLQLMRAQACERRAVRVCENLSGRPTAMIGCLRACCRSNVVTRSPVKSCVVREKTSLSCTNAAAAARVHRRYGCKNKERAGTYCVNFQVGWLPPSAASTIFSKCYLLCSIAGAGATAQASVLECAVCVSGGSRCQCGATGCALRDLER